MLVRLFIDAEYDEEASIAPSLEEIVLLTNLESAVADAVGRGLLSPTGRESVSGWSVVATRGMSPHGRCAVHFCDGDQRDLYDRSQCDDHIKDGDVLVSELTRSTALLFKAWPVLVAGEHQADKPLHDLSPDTTWQKVSEAEGVDYAYAAKIAKLLWLGMNVVDEGR